MKRILFGIILGALAAYLVIWLVDQAVAALFPVVPATDPTVIARAEGVARPERLPAAARVVTIAGWCLGTLVGAASAARIAHRRVTAWIVAAFVVTVAIERSAQASQPGWMIAAGLLLPWACAWAVQSAGGRRGSY